MDYCGKRVMKCYFHKSAYFGSVEQTFKAPEED